jgi:hypothetical protein
MDKTPKLKEQHFFKDQENHWAVWQWPNIPLYGWIVCELLAFIVKQHQLHAGLVQLSRAFLFTWSYLEIKEGINYFRRLLGIVVMIGIIVSYFKLS